MIYKNTKIRAYGIRYNHSGISDWIPFAASLSDMIRQDIIDNTYNTNRKMYVPSEYIIHEVKV